MIANHAGSNVCASAFITASAAHSDDPPVAILVFFNAGDIPDADLFAEFIRSERSTTVYAPSSVLAGLARLWCVDAVRAKFDAANAERIAVGHGGATDRRVASSGEGGQADDGQQQGGQPAVCSYAAARIQV